MITEAQQQGVNAIMVRSVHQVLRMESQHRASVTGRLLSQNSILVSGMAQRKALVSEDALHCNMCGVAARRYIAYLLS